MDIGPHIKARRQALSLTLNDLAERSGVSRAMLCDVEAGKKNPTIRIVGQIAAGLDCSISDLLDLEEPAQFHVYRRKAQQVLVDPESGIERRLMSTTMKRRGIEILHYTYPPGQGLIDFPAHPRGVVEFATVVSGRLRLTINDESIELGPGDAVSYRADVAHGCMNIAEEETRVIYITDYTTAGRNLPLSGQPGQNTE